MTALNLFLSQLISHVRDDEAGQSSVEYLGIVVVAATLVVVLIGAAAGWGDSITTAIGQRISDIAGG